MKPPPYFHGPSLFLVMLWRAAAGLYFCALVTGSARAQPQVRLLASDGATGDLFGISVSLSGSYAVVGAYWDDVRSNVDQGSAYVFERGGDGVWRQTAVLRASDGAAGDHFGVSVSLSGSYAVVGAWLDDVGSNVDQGSAYLFERGDDGVWRQTAVLRASDGAASDRLGASVSLSGSYAVVGAYGDDVGSNADQGSAYLFERRGDGVWRETAVLRANEGATNDYFGSSVSVSSSYALVGASDHDIGSNIDQGSAYVFGWGSDGVTGNVVPQPVSVTGSHTVAGAPSVEVESKAIRGSEDAMAAGLVTSSSHPDPSLYYSSSTVEIACPRIQNITVWGLDQSPTGEPRWPPLVDAQHRYIEQTSGAVLRWQVPIPLPGTWWLHVRSRDDVTGALGQTSHLKVNLADVVRARSLTHSDTTWDLAHTVGFEWAGEAGIDTVRYLVDQTPGTALTARTGAATTTARFSVPNVPDGVNYVHIAGVDLRGVVGPTRTIRVNVGRPPAAPVATAGSPTPQLQPRDAPPAAGLPPATAVPAVSGPRRSPSATVAGISLSPIPAVESGTTMTIPRELAYSDGSHGPVRSPVQWTSRNPRVATVGAGGEVSGVSPGEAWIVARDERGRLDSVLVSVRAPHRTTIAVRPEPARSPSGGVDPSGPSRTRFAVLVGVSNYLDTSIPKLRFPDDGVDRLRAALVEYGNVKAEHVLTLKSAPSAGELPATRGMIESVFTSTLRDSLAAARRRSPGDTLEVFVYFSGHGKPIGGEIGTARPRVALLPQDAMLSANANYVKDTDLWAWLSALPEGSRRYVVVDACFGALARDLMSVEMPDYADVAARSRDAVNVLVASSGPQQTAQDGLFARYLVEGLQQSRRLDGADQRLTVRELMDYVQPRVVRERAQQRPEILLGQDEVLVDNTRGYVTIESTPPGAGIQVSVNGRDYWRTPPATPAVELSLPVGTFVLTLDLGPDYDPIQDPNFIVTPGYSTPRRYEFRPATGRIIGQVIDDQRRPVVGAKVTLRGGAGQTVAQEVFTGSGGVFVLDAVRGSYTALVIAATGYRERVWTPGAALAVQSRDTTSVGQIVMETPRFSITLVPNLANSVIYLDGDSLGQAQGTRPFIIHDVRPDVYLLEVRHLDADPWQQDVVVTADGPSQERIEARSVAVYGRLTVEAVYQGTGEGISGAFVLVDEVYAGETPLTDYRLRAGTHSVVVRGIFGEWNGSAQVSPQRTETVRAALPRR